MIKVVTGKMMQELDRMAIEQSGVPSLMLMENAGRSVFKEVEQFFGNVQGKVISIIAGKGNNGGDGTVVARHLLERGAIPRVFLTAEPKQIKGDAKINLALFQEWGGECIVIKPGTLRSFKKALGKSDLIVDALFGTGLSASIEGINAQVVKAMNASGVPILSVDIPSGIHSDHGQVLGVAVQAQVTLTFGLPKQGCLLAPGIGYTGQLKIVDIGFPPSVLGKAISSLYLISRQQVSSLFPPRPLNSHKGSFGHVAVIAGSKQTTGASLLASSAAMRSGAGLVTLATPVGIHSMVSGELWEVMSHPLPETQMHTLSTKAEGPILSFLEGKRALALGPGISSHPETQELVLRLLPQLSIPTVLDADALNALPGHLDLLSKSKNAFILTPHPGEMSRLMGTSVQRVEADRLGAVRNLARDCGQCVVLKGARTLVAEPSGETFINPTGNPGMATAGIGDVLTGVIAGFLAQGLSPLESAIAGTYVHGAAGDLAAQQKGHRGLIARDLIENLPLAMLNLEKESS